MDVTSHPMGLNFPYKIKQILYIIISLNGQGGIYIFLTFIIKSVE